MSGRYAFSFSEDSVYHSVRELLVRTVDAQDGGLVVDLGCGYGALAEPVAEAGLVYVGVDVAADGLADLERRGFRTAQHDLTDLDGLEKLLLGVAEDARVAAVLMLDTLEHLPQPDVVLRRLHEVALRLGSPVLLVSVPNVTHVDVAAKLLMGRWDSTPTGLLDDTHLQMFSSARLDDEMRRAGWHASGRLDFRLNQSDQHFPDDLPALVPGTPLSDLLRLVRTSADEHGYVNQFVRAYIPSAPAVRRQAEERRPFLSVLVRTTGNRPETLRDLLLCLAAQVDDDFEVLLLAHGVLREAMSELGVLLSQQAESLRSRVRLVPVEPGGGRSRPLNVGVEQARGRYVCVVDDDDVVLANYVAEFRRLAEQRPGRVLRTVVVEQDVVETSWGAELGYAATSGFRYSYPPDYDLVSHMHGNYTPFCGLAFPTALFRDLGYRFDEALAVLEDWEMQLRAVMTAGVVTSPAVTSIYHWWTGGTGDNSKVVHSDDHWTAARGRVVAELDARPLLLPAGTFARLHRELARMSTVETDLIHARKELGETRKVLQESEHQRAELMRSTSWRVTWPLRSVSDRLRGR